MEQGRRSCFVTSSSPRAMDARMFSLVSLMPASRAENLSVLAVHSSTTLSSLLFCLNSRMSLRICGGHLSYKKWVSWPI